MRYLGIDYGEKRIGVALSDEEGKMAFPLIVLNNDLASVKNVDNICQEEKVEAIVIGESCDLSGKPNEISKDIEKFEENLKEKLNLPIHFEKEFMTSLHSNIPKTKNIFSARKIKKDTKEKNDSSAATLILQRFLDRINNQ